MSGDVYLACSPKKKTKQLMQLRLQDCTIDCKPKSSSWRSLTGKHFSTLEKYPCSEVLHSKSPQTGICIYTQNNCMQSWCWVQTQTHTHTLTGTCLCKSKNHPEQSHGMGINKRAYINITCPCIMQTHAHIQALINTHTHTPHLPHS